MNAVCGIALIDAADGNVWEPRFFRNILKQALANSCARIDLRFGREHRADSDVIHIRSDRV